MITGENDGGKTAFLQAVGLLLQSYKVDAQDKSKGGEPADPICVEGRFVEPEAPEDAARTYVRVEVANDLKPRYLARQRVHSKFGCQPSDLKLNELRERLQQAGIASPGGVNKPPYVAAAEAWIVERPASEFTDSWVTAPQEVIDRLPTAELFASANAFNPQEEIKRHLSREAVALLGRPPYSESLNQLNQRLRAELEPRIERIRGAIAIYCPDVTSTTINATFDFLRPPCSVSLSVQKGLKESCDINKTGEGCRRRITLAVYEANLRALAEAEEGTSTVLLYDEPDTHFDYATQRKLFDVLARQAQLKSVQVVVATHSLNFIDRVPLRSIHHFRLNDALSTEVESLVSDSAANEERFMASMCSGLGLRNSVILDERCFLIVEGETEEAALDPLFRLYSGGRGLLAAGICPLNTKGCGPIREFVKLLVRKWQRKCLVLVDRDAEGDVGAWLKGLGFTEGANLFLIGSPKEFEDAFSDQTWADVLQQEHPPAVGEPPWTPKDFQGLRSKDKFSEEVNNLARRRCRNHRISKPDLGFALGQGITSKTLIPEVLRDCFKAAIDLAN